MTKITGNYIYAAYVGKRFAHLRNLGAGIMTYIKSCLGVPIKCCFIKVYIKVMGLCGIDIT